MLIKTKRESTQAVSVVDTGNIFNSIKRKVYSNIFVLCFAILTFVTTCYTTPEQVFVIGGTEIRSNEGTNL